MLHRRSSPSNGPDGPFPLRPLTRLSQLFEERIKNALCGFGPMRFLGGRAPGTGLEEIRPAIPASWLKAELEALPADQHLAASGQFSVHYAPTEQFPPCPHQIRPFPPSTLPGLV